ncbi:MAG: response regulator [Oscillospiraceae bacterium]|nr:response regulator [Oscillospiraceae bacterium]
MYKLLIVDDEPQILEGIKSTLDWASLGFYRVETARTYEEAVNIAVEIEPDVALFDVCLGDKYCFEVIKRLIELGMRTVFVLFSGYGEFEYAREAIRCGARAYLLKPVNRAELKAVMDSVIVNDLGGAPPKSEEEADTDPVCGVKYSDLSKLTRKIIIIVKSEYTGSLSLKSVAEKFKMNSAYLGQIFLKETHMKFSEYLLVYRLRKAADMIQGTGYKISLIAKKVGYSNLNYFYSQFHDYYGFSPTDLRRGKGIPDNKAKQRDAEDGAADPKEKEAGCENG